MYICCHSDDNKKNEFMRLEQLQLFEHKGSFNSSHFEATENIEIFKKIGQSISDAFAEFSTYSINKLDNTTRSNILNNLVVNYVNEICSDERFKYYPTLTNTRRSFAILDEQYILFFKKFPVSNVKTSQDDVIKNQELGKHNLFVAYHVDDFWSSISKLELQYFSSPIRITYTYDITEFLTEQTVELVAEKVATPNIQIKKDISIREAQ